MPDIASTLIDNPCSSRADLQGSPSVNKILSTVYDGSAATGMSRPTFFDCERPRQIQVSVHPVDGAGVQKTGTGFNVGLYRSLDFGDSWQLYASYTAVAEVAIECASGAVQWQFRLTTKGADNIRVRAKT